MYTNEIQQFDSELQNEPEIETNAVSLTTKITTYLRWVGTALIILSAFSFMIQGHEELLPTYRYWVGLAFTLLLCGGGLVCAYLFRETKGARIFFGLGAAFVTVQVSQVGAMLYGYWHGQNALQPEYSWLQFMDVSPTVIAFDFILTGIVMLLVSYAGFSILARKHVKILMQAVIIGNILLILPVRDANAVAFIIAGLFLFLRAIELRLHQENNMRLLEGIAARALISLPLLIIAGRSLLHPGSFFLAIVVVAILMVGCIHDIKRYTESTTLIYISQWIGTFAALAVWLTVADRFVGVSRGLYSLMLPLSVILFLLSKHVDFHARLYRSISSIMAVYLTYGAMVDGQALAPVFALATGIALTIAGIRYREKIPLFTGNLCFGGGLVFYCSYAIDLYSAAPWVTWVSSIALGLVVILLASYLENREKQIVQKAGHYLKELKTWA